MNERAIWRPNSFTVEEWDNLGREGQIQWWKSQQTPSTPSPPWRGAELFIEGAITQTELLHYVFERLTEDNVEQFLAVCPPDALELLRTLADQLPAERDDGGGRFRTFHMGSYVPWASAEEIRESETENDRGFREGWKVFRLSDNR